MEITSIDEFYKQAGLNIGEGIDHILPDGIGKDTGHFNVFEMELLLEELKKSGSIMPYNRRAYYKISLVVGRNIAEYADKTIQIEKNALLFATPKIPYNWVPQDERQSGIFCIFTADFLSPGRTRLALDDLPLFKPGGYPVFQLTDMEAANIGAIFRKMQEELTSGYTYKYALIRNYILELIHYGQKLQPASTVYTINNASERISSLFMELLERQFPVEFTFQKLALRTAKDYADRLAVHVNHLNRILKEKTGMTTTDIIGRRIVQEAKILLKQTDWSISEISYCLGFEQIAHFSNFFKKHTSLTPMAYRM